MVILLHFYLSKVLNARLLLVFLHCGTATFTLVKALSTSSGTAVH